MHLPEGFGYSVFEGFRVGQSVRSSVGLRVYGEIMGRGNKEAVF